MTSIETGAATSGFGLAALTLAFAALATASAAPRGFGSRTLFAGSRSSRPTNDPNSNRAALAHAVNAAASWDMTNSIQSSSGRKADSGSDSGTNESTSRGKSQTT